MPLVPAPNESPAYREARDALLSLELDLRRRMEAVAAARRALPPGGAAPDGYAFAEAGPEGVRTQGLPDLFREGSGTLAVYCFMFPRSRGDLRAPPLSGRTAALPLAEGPCPSCTALLDQLDGTVPHFEGMGGSFAVLAEAPPERLRDLAADRGWRHLRLLSSGGTTFKRDYGALDPEDGEQSPLLVTFERGAADRPNGAVRHVWTSEMFFAPADPGQDPRHVGPLEPLWNLWDMARAGRPAMEEELQYPSGA